MEIINIVVLSVSGILLTYAGIMRLVQPLKSICLKTYLDDPKMKLEGKVDIFNEMRGAGASIAVSGIIILLGTILPQLMMTSFVVAILTFVGYAFGRLVSFKNDGKPGQQMTQGLMMEIILGAANIFCLVTILM